MPILRTEFAYYFISIVIEIMVKYTCPTCYKVFPRKSQFDYHINRKYPCEPSINEDHNVVQEDSKYDLLIKKIEELEKKNNELEKDTKIIKELQVKNKEFEKEIKKLKKINTKANSNVNSNNSTINNTINNTMLNVTLTPKAFGTENIDFLENNDVISRKILNRGFQSLPEYIKTIHFDKNKPENHNVYIPNWRDKTRALVYDGKNWNLEQTDSVMTDLKDKGIEFIQRKYDELDKANPVDAKIIEKLGRFLESYNTEEKEKIDILNEDISLVLYNNREIPSNTRKNSIKQNSNIKTLHAASNDVEDKKPKKITKKS